MNINRKDRRTTRWTIDLRWASALAFAAVTFAACGTDSSEDGAAADVAVEAPEQQPATPPGGGIAFANSEQHDQQRYEADQRAALIQRAAASDRHLETLAEQAEARARAQQAQGSDQHLETLAEQAEAQARAQQAQGSDRHLETLAEQAEAQARAQQAQGSDRHLENLAD